MERQEKNMEKLEDLTRDELLRRLEATERGLKVEREAAERGRERERAELAEAECRGRLWRIRELETELRRERLKRGELEAILKCVGRLVQTPEPEPETEPQFEMKPMVPMGERFTS